MERRRSDIAWERARRVLVGGVNSPVRAFGSVGGDPVFISKGKGSVITDLDGNEYIDYVGSWGPLILGHADERVIEAVRTAAERGTSFGAPTEAETLLAEKVIEAFPVIEKIRFTSSGTEATMSALRLARGATGRERIVKFTGGYHGHSDSLLVAAGSGATTLGVPSSPGVPRDLASGTSLLPYNDMAAARALFEERGDEIAAVIVEPVAGNMGVIPPRLGFLETLRDLTARAGSILIFDEVITGFRIAFGGAVEVFGMEPDLVCLGKILGAGLPVGAFGGRGEIMSHLAPEGPVYQAGTLSGNPLAMAAGLACIEALSGEGIYAELDRKGGAIEEALTGAAAETGIPLVVNRIGSMMTAFFNDLPEVRDYDGAVRSDTARYAAFHRGMLGEGIYLAPSQFEAAFVSLAHTDSDLDRTAQAAARVLARLS